MPNRGGEGAAWQLPDFNGTIVTEVQAGELLDVSWDLHYAHQGGFRIELYDANATLINRWNSSDHWGCAVDSTVQNVTIRLPNQPCEGCILRFERQALEWGATYLFKSCAILDITSTPNACQGCSSHGTCGAAGSCQCDSSEDTGFFYGSHCEFENECETDDHCGSNGKCLDTGDESGPAKQCFCEAGFFGDVVKRPSGMEVRMCDRASALTLDPADVDSFGEGYPRSFDSSEQTFSAYMMPGDSTFEFAMKAQTTSWVALGLRSVGDAPAGAAAATTDATAPAEGEASAAEGEAPAAEVTNASSEPAAENEAPSAPATGAATTTAPAAQAEAEGGNRRLLAMRALAESDDDEYKPAAAAEGAAPAAEGAAATAEGAAPAAEGAAATAEGAAPAAEGAAATAEGAAAEGEGGAAAGACAAVAVADMFVPGALGAGWVVTLEEAAAAASGVVASAEGADAESEGAGAEGAAEGAAEATPAAAGEGTPASRRRVLGMPAVEAEAVPAVRHLTGRRSLLQAAAAEGATSAAEGATPAAEGATPAAEGEGASAAEAEGDGEYAGADGKIEYSDAIVMPADAVVGSVADGPCAGYPTTPAGNHAMVNQDVVFAAALEVDGVQYFRIVDMFTPSRAKPLPDHVFCADGVCGSDDIVDAIGVQVDGTTYIKYVRDNKTPDANTATDACFSDDQSFHVIYAYGQLTESATHVPDSSLEILDPAAISNKDFYKEDVLKFHGGGIGVQYDGRGTLSTSANLFEEEGAGGGACTPSTQDGFACSVGRLGGSVLVHYNPVAAGDTAATFAVETPSAGYVAFAFAGDSPSSMIGATAVIATTSAGNSEAGVYALTGKSDAGVIEIPSALAAGPGRRLSQDAPFSVYDVTVMRDGGSTVMQFTRDFDDTFDGAAGVNALVAHNTNPALAYHTDRDAFSFALSADGGVVNIVDPNDKHRRSHAILMLVGWGLLLPLGVILANTLRTLGPVWFMLHRIIQIVGLAIASGGVILALVKFESLEDDHKHRRLGLTVMILGWLQPFNALIRPHPPKEGERKSALRWAWEILHKGIGYATLVMAVITIFWGLELAETFGGLMDDHDTYRSAYIGVLIALGVLWVALLGFHFVNARRIAKKKPVSSDGSGGVQKPLDAPVLAPPPAGGQFVTSAPVV